MSFEVEERRNNLGLEARLGKWVRKCSYKSMKRVNRLDAEVKSHWFLCWKYSLSIKIITYLAI